MRRRDHIGYVCRRGHYDFTADPEHDTGCGNKWVAKIVVEWNDDSEWVGQDEVLDDCESHLAHVIETWRKG